MNPLSLIPNKVRMAMYLVYALGVVVLAYTEAQGWTGEAEKNLWLGIGAVLNVAAASNVPIGSNTPNFSGGFAQPIQQDYYVEDTPE